MSNSVTGLGRLISSYKADSEKTGNRLAEFLMNLITHSSVRSKIMKSAGSDAHHISMSIDDLVEEVRQEAIAACLVKFRDPKFQVRSDHQSAQYVFNAVQFAAHGLVDRHLGSRRPEGQGRTKGLKDSPFKWGTEDTDEAGYAAVRAIGADAIDPEQSDVHAYLDSIKESNAKLHYCLTLHLDNFDQQEIASIMGVGDRTVRNYLRKIEEELAEFINA